MGFGLIFVTRTFTVSLMKALKKIGLFFLMFCLQSPAFSQASDGLSQQYDFLHAWNDQLTPSHSAGEWAARGFPANEAPEMEARLAAMRQQAAIQAEVEKQRQKAAQAAAIQNWNNGADNRERTASECMNAALSYNLDLASKGDDYGQYRMGQRYRDGDGVPKDLQKARQWFAKAAAQGDKIAAKELAQLLIDFPELSVTNRSPVEIKPPPGITNAAVSTKK
jgi:hypothetical protein